MWPLMTRVLRCEYGTDLLSESTLAVLVVYHALGGAWIDSDGCVLTFGSPVRGEAVRSGAYGVNWSVLNLSSEGPAPVM